MTSKVEPFEPDAVMTRVGVGIGLAARGERVQAREVFGAIWDDIGGDTGDPFYRCAIAHSMADVQDGVDDELRWDLRALSAAGLITDERAAQGGVSSVAVFFPSLHLNLGECYRKLGDVDRARTHLQLGLAATDALGNDGYSAMIRRGLGGLEERINSAAG